MTFEQDEIEDLKREVEDLDAQNTKLRGLVLKVANEGLTLEQAMIELGAI